MSFANMSFLNGLGFSPATSGVGNDANEATPTENRTPAHNAVGDESDIVLVSSPTETKPQGDIDNDWVLLLGDDDDTSFNEIVTNVSHDRMRNRPKYMGSPLEPSMLLERKTEESSNVQISYAQIASKATKNT
eukprot:m.55391 g.55391  ORF g.55391 m.55391 type:complete len:133 (+) comp10982_c0_seq1:143-541(+)